MRLTPELAEVLNKLGESAEIEDLSADLKASDKKSLHDALGALVGLGVLVTGDDDHRLPPVWEHWGDIAERFHVESRDANYLVHAQERTDLADSIVAGGGEPAGSKEYPDRPALMLPRRPVPLRTPVEDVFAARSTHRAFAEREVPLDQFSTVLSYTFGPQRFLDGGVFGAQQGRVSASAGARHEVEAYVVAHAVQGVTPGLYHYAPMRHALELLDRSATRERVAELSFAQEGSFNGAFTVFTTAIAERLAWKYRHPRAYRLWMYDAGHYGQTFALTCAALGLGPFQTVAFQDSEVERFLGVDADDEFAVYLLAAGVPAGRE
ncbi:SagB/ThcOx family dehydrogenase [Streptomyces sp. NPDC045251]|uniref:SagB/ThcOx family dehydrogenase n=1 Tax=unclassified Streptomyces TaxID=2593676 RepID=UPI00340CC040